MNCKCVILSFFVIIKAANVTQNPGSTKDSSAEFGFCYCMIDIRTKSKDDYLPAYLNAKNRTILYPYHNMPFILIHTGDIVEVHCEETGGIVINKEVIDMPYRQEMLTVVCLHEERFLWEGKVVDITTIRCKKSIPVQIRYTNEKCDEASEIFDFGYQFSNKFVAMLKLCYTDYDKSTVYVSTKIRHPLYTWDMDSYYPHLKSLPEEFSDKFFDIPTKKILFNKDYLRHQVNQQLQLPSNDTRYINDLYSLYRGQLISHKYFLYPFEKKLTYYYLNTAPQWTNLNRLVWEDIDNELRFYAFHEQTELIIIAGTFDILSFPDIYTIETPLVLHLDQEVPIPEIIWKVAIDEKNNAGIAFVALNNPYPYIKHKKICKDISPHLKWFYYNKGIFRGSTIYVCTVSSFNQMIPHTSNYRVSRLIYLRDKRFRKIRRRKKRFRTKITAQNDFYI